MHVGATLTLSGRRAFHTVAAHRRDRFAGGAHSVSFHLDGYYSSTSEELCMLGSGTYSMGDGWPKHLPDVVLRLRFPSPPSLKDPFVTGELKGAGFDAITLISYAEGDSYEYGQRASCPPLQPPPAVRGALQVLGASFSCAHLREQLVSSYKLQHVGSVPASSTSPAFLRLPEPRMHVGQAFVVKEAAVVAEGRWDSTQSTLCLRACRVVRSGPTSLAVQEQQDCGIGMSFWFPAVWTIRERSIVAGMLWNSSQGTAATASNAAAAAAGAVSASSIDFDINRDTFSDVKYTYTRVDEAKQRYFADVLRSHENKANKGTFPSASYSYHDFQFRFHMENRGSELGEAYPVTIGSAIVDGDRLPAGGSFSSWHAKVDIEHELLKVSYDIYTRHLPPRVNWMNMSSPVSIEERLITAEGVYDPKKGVLCMIGCRELEGSTDCQILITVHFASLDAKAQGHGRGVISSLRAKTDPLFFSKMDIALFGMYAEQVSASISRMDLESVMLVVSTTLSCIFTALQILHAKRSLEASASTSITMLVVLAMGYVAPLVISSEALFVSRGTEYAPFQRKVPYELKQAMLRVPTLIAFVLQLRLLQLAWSARRSAAGRSKDGTSAAAAAERRALWVCLPLYLLGGALTIVLHMANTRRAAREDSLAVRVGPEPATLWEDLASSAGLALDGFLLPQVAMNAFSGGKVRAVSPWFYVGGTVVRAMPHVYDVVRSQGYVPSLKPSNVYASPLDDRFGVAWDIVVPCGAALLTVLLFLQQRLGGTGTGTFLFRSGRTGEYQMVSTF
ncbi:unnamed protein product [Miscanthus lutarioriparius]|uniref:RING-type E3 ubiquitin transferase n=1 Tax=Miscanthus lutarioriparius TaxID=422564 RepID=A0A811NVA7_9POAL|nr:unnamed protein product [Miscanthus lutarioriparius]